MSWFQKLMPSRIRTEGPTTRKVPDGLWTKCSSCDAVLYRPELERSMHVCPKCGYHMSLTGRERLDVFLDEEDREELGTNLAPTDPLRFKDSRRYRERLNVAQKQSGENDAMVVMQGRVLELPVVCCAFDFKFMAGSMGSVVGEKFMVAVNRCLDEELPLVCFTASGGARMQEGLFSLLQMSKTSAGLARMAEQGLPYISVLSHPTTGGVSASLGMLGDINIGEPGALIGFAGPRVIEQTVRERLPEGFQRSEFLLEKGAIDMILDRREMRQRIHSLLGLMLGGGTGRPEVRDVSGTPAAAESPMEPAAHEDQRNDQPPDQDASGAEPAEDDGESGTDSEPQSSSSRRTDSGD